MSMNVRNKITAHTLTLCALAGLAALLGAGCQNDTTTLPGFEAESSAIEAEASGGRYTFTIRSSREWTAVADAPWVMISPANGRGEVECTVIIDSTLVNDQRTTDIRFSADGELLQNVAVRQDGYPLQITPQEAEHEIAASASRSERWFEVEISSNVEFKVEAAYEGDEQWLEVGDYDLTLDRGARPRTTRLRLEWKMNSDPEERVATLHLLAANNQELDTPSSIIVRQMAAPLIEDNREGDSLAIVTIFEKLECWSDNGISTTESMRHWNCVRLWEATDEGLPAPEAVGRVRDLELNYFNTEDGIPHEIRHLKYLETLSLFGNVNTMLKSIDMGEEVCELEYLKALRVAAFGLVSLPRSFAALGDTLEELDLNSNNFASIPEVLTPDNFPHLRVINLASNRRSSLSDLRQASSTDGDIGLYENTAESDALRRLLLWEQLEELTLSYNYIEGTLPDFRVGEDGVRAYTADDVAHRGDTLRWAVENNLPRVLPNARILRLNLNFFNGELPEWLLYHPRLMEWGAETLVYQQQEGGYNSAGQAVGFSNVPSSTEPYFERYPLMRGRFEFNDEMEE